MPSFPPRKDTTKKQNQLLKRETELLHAIRINSTKERLIKVAEKYRAAQISLLKAKQHVIKEKELQKKIKHIMYQKLRLRKNFGQIKLLKKY